MAPARQATLHRGQHSGHPKEKAQNRFFAWSTSQIPWSARTPSLQGMTTRGRDLARNCALAAASSLGRRQRKKTRRVRGSSCQK
jgi:hypothetical protein